MMDHILRKYFKYRQKQMDHVAAHPFKYQNSILRRIIRNNSKTKFGVEHGLSKIKSHADYVSGIPVRSYEELFPYIQSMLEGQQNILCADPVYWFAKSSGTSNNRSKYIPVSAKYLKKGHLKCAWDAAGMIYNEDKRAKLFEDRSLIMGGSIEKINSKINAGDISAIILHHFPPIGRRFYTPDFETALMSDWEGKIKRMASVTSRQNVTLLAGVPTWTIVLLHEILKQTGKENISEVWPNLRSYLHGGVHFEPYKDIFRELIPDENVIYREVFNASEGYFSIQNEKDQDGMLLLCDHEIFYEFIPESDISTSSPVVLSLSQVNLDTNYAMVISNTSGLYRYLLGDVIRFVSLNPFKIKVVGRTHEQINTFGEELSKANVMNALELTSKEIDFRIREFTIAPKPMTIEEGGKHEWFIEFIKAPINLAEFEQVLDSNLRRINSDYDAKRKHVKALG
ncbi:MAG: GH3 auxin-responsive promoter family protein, partial [Bacteroidia bacterium]|nr:GH3 auxin-responsive promoter family protein [Bacteroidia bacterium]